MFQDNQRNGAQNGAHPQNTAPASLATLNGQTFGFSLFDGKNDNTPKAALLDWRQTVALLERRSVRDAKDGPLISGASYPPDAARGNAGVSFVSLAILDFDGGATLPEIEAGVSRLNSGTGCAAFIYSTHSHEPGAGALKYRLVLPLLEPVAGADWPDVWKRLAQAFDGAPDRAAKDAARIHYLPSCPKEREHFAEQLELDGEPLDVATLPELPKAPERAAISFPEASGDPYARTALDAEIGRLCRTTGKRNDALNCAARRLGQFIGAGRLDRLEVEHGLMNAARANGYIAKDGESVTRRTMQSGLDAGEREPNRKGELLERFERNGSSGSLGRRGSTNGAAQIDGPGAQPDARHEGEPSSAPRFRRVGLQEIFERPSPDFLIYGLLPETGTALLSASQGSFKSFLALDMALCVATGKPFHGRKVKRGRVLYIAAEGAATAKDRARAWLGRWRDETPDGEEFPALFEQIEEPVQIGKPDELRALLALLDGEQFALIVLDTLTLCALGLEENSASEMGAFFACCALLSRATGALVMPCHHNNKDGNYRGSSAMPAAVDAHLTLKRSNRRADLRTVLGCEKMRGAEEFEPFAFQGQVFDLGELDSSGRARTSLFFEPCEMPEEAEAPQRSEPGAQIEAGALDVLRREFPKGARANAWKDKCIELKICSKSSFFNARLALLNRGEVENIAGFYLATSPLVHQSAGPLVDSGGLPGTGRSTGPIGPTVDLNGLPETGRSTGPIGPPPFRVDYGPGGPVDCQDPTDQKPTTRRARNSADGEPYGAPLERLDDEPAPEPGATGGALLDGQTPESEVDEF